MYARRVVAAIGLLIGLAGLLEIVAPFWTLSIAHSLYGITPIRIASTVGIAMGVALVIAALRSRVGMRLFVLLFGGIIIGAGLLAVAEPGLIRDMGYSLLLRHSWPFQRTVLWITGFLRMGIGGALIYAAAKPPQRSTEAARHLPGT